MVGENLGPKNQVWDWLAQVIGRSLEIWRHLWRTFRWGFFYRFVFSKIIFWSFFNIFSDILLKEPPEIWWNALGSFVVAGIHQFGMRLAGSRFQSTGGQLSACDADLYAISFGGHECIGRESQMPCDNNFHLICWTNYRSNMKKNHFSCCRRVDIIFEMHPEPISYFLALELHTIFKRHLGISRIFGLQTCTKLICLSMLTFESVEIYLFVLWKFQAVVGIQGVCRYTANFCFSLLVSWNRSLKCGYNYLQLIVTPQKHFQTWCGHNKLKSLAELGAIPRRNQVSLFWFWWTLVLQPNMTHKTRNTFWNQLNALITAEFFFANCEKDMFPNNFSFDIQ